MRAISIFRAKAISSFRVSSGQCLLTYHSPEDGKQKRNNLFLKLWFNPPREIYVQVTIAADPKAIIVGSNDERFWLSLRPKEMSSYYEGRWSEVRGFDGLMISPMILLEAFGIVATEPDVSGGPVWLLKNKGPCSTMQADSEPQDVTSGRRGCTGQTAGSAGFISDGIQPHTV